MHPEQAALDAVASTAGDLAARVAAAAARLDGGDDQPYADDLFEVERALLSARRRLQIVLRRMESG